MDLQSTGEVTAGLRPARITYPQSPTRGLQIPEDKVCNPQGQRVIVPQGQMKISSKQSYFIELQPVIFLNKTG